MITIPSVFLALSALAVSQLSDLQLVVQREFIVRMLNQESSAAQGEVKSIPELLNRSLEICHQKILQNPQRALRPGEQLYHDYWKEVLVPILKQLNNNKETQKPFLKQAWTHTFQWLEPKKILFYEFYSEFNNSHFDGDDEGLESWLRTDASLVELKESQGKLYSAYAEMITNASKNLTHTLTTNLYSKNPTTSQESLDIINHLLAETDLDRNIRRDLNDALYLYRFSKHLSGSRAENILFWYTQAARDRALIDSITQNPTYQAETETFLESLRHAGNTSNEVQRNLIFDQAMLALKNIQKQA